MPDDAHTARAGDKAPDLALSDDHDVPVRLSDFWRDGPVMLVFVRHFVQARGTTKSWKPSCPAVPRDSGWVTFTPATTHARCRTLRPSTVKPRARPRRPILRWS